MQDLPSIDEALNASCSTFSLSLELVRLLLSVLSSITLQAVQLITLPIHHGQHERRGE